jgi:glycosyltransferase involved in cell wall biosynthesis
MSKKYSVVMMSYLGDYFQCSNKREIKFIRAVNSFIGQTYKNKELIIVSDGCVKTVNLYNNFYKEDKNIKLILKEKQKERYPGFLRQVGIENSTGDRILYLDSDDYLGRNHIKDIDNGFKDEWEYCLGYLSLLHDKHRGEDKDRDSLNPLDYDWHHGRFGVNGYQTGIICHNRDVKAKWQSIKSEDYNFINDVVSNHVGGDILVNSYYMCHMHGDLYDI